MNAITQALWRYVSTDSCDCDCLPLDGPATPCPGSHMPCRYCEGSAVLSLAGVSVLETGLCEEGRHYQTARAAMQAAILDDLAAHLENGPATGQTFTVGPDGRGVPGVPDFGPGGT